jgi:hypothetical protein
VNPAAVRRIALSLPEVTEAPHHEYASFRIRGRIFATLPPDGAYLHVFVADDEREPALALNPGFVESLRWGGHVVGVRILLAEAKPNVVRELLANAWLRKAPRRLVAPATTDAKSAPAKALPGTVRSSSSTASAAQGRSPPVESNVRKRRPSASGELPLVFAELRPILARFAGGLVVVHDSADNYHLDTRHVMPNRKRLFFGAAQIRRAYVSFHLMPVYVRPDLLRSISPALRSRMQGKSCFNFRRVDPPVFAELSALADRAYSSFVRAGFVAS